MKLESLNNVLNNPDHPIVQEVMHNFDSKDGDILKCVDCGTDYQRGVMDFYQLCNPCFCKFNEEKMKARWEWIRENMFKKDNEE